MAVDQKIWNRKKNDVASICRRSAGSADEFPEII